MSDEYKNRREDVIEGRNGPSGRARLMVGTAMLGAFGVAAYFLLVPAGVETSGPDTSQTSDIQSPEAAPGVDTRMPARPEIEQTETTSTPAVMTPMPQQLPGSDDRDAERERIAQLERELELLRNAQGDDADAEAFQQELDALRDQLERERAEAEERYQTLLTQLTQLTQNTGSGTADMSEDEREARRRLEKERARRAAIAEAQIMSDGIVLDASGARTGSGNQGGAASGEGESGRRLSSNEQFIEEAGSRSYETVRATQIANPGRTIVQGTTLNAVLETAVSTELPGVIRAVVTDDVMSYDGMNVLIPQGSRLIGSYNSDVSVVQDRVQIAWNRAVTPEGVSVELGGYGADALGMSGQAGSVDARFRQRFGSAALISLIGAAPEVVVSRNANSTASDTAQDVGDDLATASQGVMGDYLSAGPVIYIDQGTYMTVFVNRDLVF